MGYCSIQDDCALDGNHTGFVTQPSLKAGAWLGEAGTILGFEVRILGLGGLRFKITLR